jgi:hypothetical protein
MKLASQQYTMIISGIGCHGIIQGVSEAMQPTPSAHTVYAEYRAMARKRKTKSQGGRSKNRRKSSPAGKRP